MSLPCSNQIVIRDMRQSIHYFAQEDLSNGFSSFRSVKTKSTQAENGIYGKMWEVMGKPDTCEYGRKAFNNQGEYSPSYKKAEAIIQFMESKNLAWQAPVSRSFFSKARGAIRTVSGYLHPKPTSEAGKCIMETVTLGLEILAMVSLAKRAKTFINNRIAPNSEQLRQVTNAIAHSAREYKYSENHSSLMMPFGGGFAPVIDFEVIFGPHKEDNSFRAEGEYTYSTSGNSSPTHDTPHETQYEPEQHDAPEARD